MNDLIITDANTWAAVSGYLKNVLGATLPPVVAVGSETPVTLHMHISQPAPVAPEAVDADVLFPAA